MLTAKSRYGNGQSVCKRCESLNRFGLNWDSSTYNIEGLEGVYCYSCVFHIAEERGEKFVSIISSVPESLVRCRRYE